MFHTLAIDLISQLSDKRYRLHTSVLYQLSLTARLTERRLDDALRGLGLTRVTWCVLLAVGNEGCDHPSSIAKFICIDRTATSRALRQMESAGLLRRNARRTDCGDGRRRMVELTAPGVALIARGTRLAERNARHFLAKLPPRGRRAPDRHSGGAAQERRH